MDEVLSENSLLLNLPFEMHSVILQFLDVPDILNARQTCTVLHRATYERGLWLRILNGQANSLPLPLHILGPLHGGALLNGYSTLVIESTVKNMRRIADAWPRRRQGPLRRLPREKSGKTLLGLEFFVDRWLLMIYGEGAVYLYDLQPSSINGNEPNREPELRTFCLLEASRQWTSYCAVVDHKGKELVVALSHPFSPYQIQIFKVDLSLLASSNLVVQDAFTLERSILPSSNRIVRAIDIENHLIVTSYSSLLEVAKWDTPNETVPREFIINVHEDSAELWDGIIAAQFMGPYILIFKTRSLILHECDPLRIGTDGYSQLPKTVLKEPLTMTFRDVSFSHCSVRNNVISQTRTFETALFAYDVTHGLFNYVVHLTVPVFSSSEVPPSLDIRLTGRLPLDVSYPSMHSTNNFESTFSPSHPPLVHLQESDHPPTPLSTFVPFSPTYPSGQSYHVHRMMHSHHLDRESRGFVSTHRMGPQGKRAVWVERKRSRPAREVQIWTRDPYPNHDSDRNLGPVVKDIERRVVYSGNSYDLREDVICCAFSEVSGTIVLGLRSGYVSILDLSC